jgi:hypothetical protein
MDSPAVNSPLDLFERQAAPVVTAQTQAAEYALQMAKAYDVIDCQPIADAANVELRQIKEKIAALNEARLGITRPMDESKRRVMDLFRPALTRLEEAETYLKAKIKGYLDAEDAKRRAEEERQREVQRQEQERLRREAEEARLKAEAEAREKERIAEEARKKGDAEAAAKALAEADAIKESGQQTAQALEQTAAVVAAPIAAAPAPKVAGFSRRTKWKSRLKSKMDLIRFVANNPQYENLLDVNEQACNRQAESLQDKLAIPGLEAYQDVTAASR